LPSKWTGEEEMKVHFVKAIAAPSTGSYSHVLVLFLQLKVVVRTLNARNTEDFIVDLGTYIQGGSKEDESGGELMELLNAAYRT
jgi:hypothetical protein